MKILILLFLILFYSSLAEAKVLKSDKCNINQIEKEDLRYLFLGIKTNYANQSIKIVYNADEKEQEIFFDEYLNKTTTQMKMYWTKMIYTGRLRPPEQSDIKTLNKFLDRPECILFFDSNEKLQKGWKNLDIL